MIIGLSGRAGSGKDTVCKMLQESFPTYGVTREAFADRLKLSAARCFFPDIDLEGALEWCNALKRPGAKVSVWHPNEGEQAALATITGREFLQHYGTEAHRDVFGYDFWVRQVVTEDLEDHEGVLVVTDVRFDNEAEAIRDVGGHIWQINRPEVEYGDSHASESPLSEELVDYEIDNDGSLDNLRAEVSIAFTHAWAAVDA